PVAGGERLFRQETLSGRAAADPRGHPDLQQVARQENRAHARDLLTMIRRGAALGGRTGKEMKFVVEGVANSAPADTTLIRLLVRGQKSPSECSNRTVRRSRPSRTRKGSRLLMRRALCGWLFSLLILSPRSLQGSNRLGSLPTS